MGAHPRTRLTVKDCMHVEFKGLAPILMAKVRVDSQIDAVPFKLWLHQNWAALHKQGKFDS